MRKTGILVLLALSFNLHIQSQNSLLWEITGNGLKAPSYLFGTYHLITSSFIDSLPVIHSCYSKTEALVGEMIMDSSSYPKMMKAMTMKDSTLDQLMSKEDYKQVGDYVKEVTGMDIRMFNKMKPVVVSTLFYKVVMSSSDKGSPMDLYFQQIAKADGKALVGLETLDEQIAVLFDGSSLRSQAAMLVKATREKDKFIAEMMKTNRCYREGNMDCIVKYMSDQDDFSKADLDHLLYSRNRNWVKILPGLMKDRTLFIAVGAGHLPGEEGVIDLLRKQGYEVKAIPLN
jgi:uncharacterized protein YbaP (TraB family)